jgi:hypothetical protein
MIFLSASIPDPRRNQKYYYTADLIAIRDAVRALATIVIPKSFLVWGGHPAITPLIRYVMSAQKFTTRNHITLYQSNFFSEVFPTDNEYFENIIFTRRMSDRESSLHEMRKRMLTDNNFKAGVFIGGMEGVEIECEMFRSIHPNASIFPVASTGAAARLIYQQMGELVDQRLASEHSYMALFRSLFESIINK